MFCAKNASPTKMFGELVEAPERLATMYEHGTFYYQFPRRHDGKPSRIMRCTSASELAWLARQVAKGSAVVVRPM